MAYPAVIAAVITAIASVYSSYEQSQTQNRIFENNQNAAIRSALDQYDAQGAAANQRREQAGQQAQQNSLAAQRARSTATAAAEASGISGLSVDQVLNEIAGQEGQNYANIAANEAWAQDQQARVNAGITAQAQDRINAAAPGNFNPIVGLLQIGAAGAGAYYGKGGPGYKGT